MKTSLATYTFTKITTDTPAVQSNCNSITFMNRTDAVATIDGVIDLQKNESFSLNNDENTTITQNFAVTFDGAAGELLIIKEVK